MGHDFSLISINVRFCCLLLNCSYSCFVINFDLNLHRIGIHLRDMRQEQLFKIGDFLVLFTALNDTR